MTVKFFFHQKQRINISQSRKRLCEQGIKLIGVLCLPKTVEIAVSIYRLNLVAVADSKAYLGLIAGLKSLSLVALLSLKGNPFNKVFGEHGVFDLAHLNLNDIVFNGINGNMLFCCCLGCSGDNFLHFLTAAHNGNAAFLNYSHNLSAVLTDIEFLFHSFSFQLSGLLILR